MLCGLFIWFERISEGTYRWDGLVALAGAEEAGADEQDTEKAFRHSSAPSRTATPAPATVALSAGRARPAPAAVALQRKYPALDEASLSVFAAGFLVAYWLLAVVLTVLAPFFDLVVLDLTALQKADAPVVVSAAAAAAAASVAAVADALDCWTPTCSAIQTPAVERDLSRTGLWAHSSVGPRRRLGGCREPLRSSGRYGTPRRLPDTILRGETSS